MNEDFIYGLFRWFRLCEIGKIYPLKIYKGDKLILNVIPCKRETDGVEGIYEAVNKEFYSKEQIFKLLEENNGTDNDNNLQFNNCDFNRNIEIRYYGCRPKQTCTDGRSYCILRQSSVSSYPNNRDNYTEYEVIKVFTEDTVVLFDIQDFLNLLKISLLENKISQTKLAKKTGISLQTINGYITNRTTPSFKNAILILTALGYDVKVSKK